jgi:hypothetical protein
VHPPVIFNTIDHRITQALGPLGIPQVSQHAIWALVRSQLALGPSKRAIARTTATCTHIIEINDISAFYKHCGRAQKSTDGVPGIRLIGAVVAPAGALASALSRQEAPAEP